MRIAINCRSFLKKQYAGIGRCTYHLINHLSQIDSVNEYLLYAQMKVYDPTRTAPKVQAANFKTKIDRFRKGIDKTVGKVDIYHAPSPESLEEIEQDNIIVTIHDVIHKAYPEGHTDSTIRLMDDQIGQAIERAKKIICISQSTKNDVQKYYNVPDERLALIYQGVDQNQFYELGEEEEKKAKAVVKTKGVTDPYILFVGTIEPRKNIHNLLKAFRIVKEKHSFQGKLVIIGMKGWMTEDLDAFLQEQGLKQDVIFLGYLSNEELLYFYSQASVFAFPSLYEGFGLPILEAFCAGVPVVTSNVTSCAEVAGDAALTIDPNQPEELAKAIQEILENKELSEELVKKGMQRAQEFTFLKTAEQTLKLYESVGQNES